MRKVTWGAIGGLRDVCSRRSRLRPTSRRVRAFRCRRLRPKQRRRRPSTRVPRTARSRCTGRTGCDWTPATRIFASSSAVESFGTRRSGTPTARSRRRSAMISETVPSSARPASIYRARSTNTSSSRPNTTSPTMPGPTSRTSTSAYRTCWWTAARSCSATPRRPWASSSSRAVVSSRSWSAACRTPSRPAARPACICRLRGSKAASTPRSPLRRRPRTTSSRTRATIST